MKDYKTLNKRPEINVYPMEKIKYQISGKILYMISCVKNITFILTDESAFYVIDNFKEKSINKYILKTTKDPKNKIKYQTNEIESQIWCHKLGTHAIIKYKNDVFYYNPNLLKEKVQELNFFYEDRYLQPYAIAFDDDSFETNDTGEILFSDYNSDIYKLQITINGQNVIRVFGRIFSFRGHNKNENNKLNVNSEEMNYFIMNENDRILDIKFLYSSKYNIQSATKGTEGKNIIIMAITNNILFQFQGKDSFDDVFSNYSIKTGDILKGYKLFLGKGKVDNFKFSTIQFINQYLITGKEDQKSETKGVLFGFMTKAGYCLGRLNNLFDYTPQTNFTIFKYVSQTPQDFEKSNKKVLPPTIIKVCQSINHIFFLYKERLVIVNKLTNRIILIKYLSEFFNDMYYDEILNGIFLYNGIHVYKIGLEHEFKYLYLDYIEIGKYDLALKTITNEDKYIKPKLHKLYAQYLFKEKRYMESAREYAFSDEIFEEVCLKFLKINNIKSLLRYLTLINQFGINNNNKNNNTKIKDDKFIQKYLINTWLFELFIEKNENLEKGKLTENIKEFMRSSKNTDDFTDKVLLYLALKIYGKIEEFVEFASLKQDFKEVILTLITYKNMKDALDFIKTNILLGVENKKIILKKLFFNYSSLFIKQNPIETIELLEKYFKINNNEGEIINLLNGIQINDIIKDDQKFKVIINYIEKLIEKPYKSGKKEINLTKNTNLHNLFILLLSCNNKNTYETTLINYLKKPIAMHYIDHNLKKEKNILNYIYFDLYFAKKIFTENPKALSLLYFLLSQYNESIEIALKYNFSEIYKIIAQNITDPKLKKQFWLKVFNFRKKENFFDAKQIVKESGGFIKIEDILPLMGDSVKIGEFKDELKDCINNYEKSVQLLNKEIKEFNYSTNLIKNDIIKSQKNEININFNKIRCTQCGCVIDENKFFMFPCKHIFDSKCLINKYIEFNKQGIGDEKFKSKVKAINNLITKINILTEKKIKGSDEAKSLNSGSSRRLPHLKSFFRNETLAQKGGFTEEEDSQLTLFNKGLNDFLDEECILCGKEVIQGTQIPFSEQDSLDWEIV